MKGRFLKILLVSCAASLLSPVLFGAESTDISERIKALGKKIQRVSDMLAIKNLMAAGRYGGTPTGGRGGSPGAGPGGPGGVSRPASSTDREYIQCFGQNDGYAYGDWISRMNANRQGGAPGSAPGVPPGSPPAGGLTSTDAQGGERGGPGGPSGGPPGGGPGSGTSLDFHLLSSYVIEIAEDGKTAKGIWYSPGVLSEPAGGGGQHMSAWIYELYASDYVKENGVWREFHRTLSTDFMTGPDKSWTDAYDTSKGVDEVARIGGILDRTKTGELTSDERGGKVPAQASVQTGGRGAPPQGGQGGPGGGMASFKDLKMVAYQSWTPTTMPQYNPKPPVPYRTFSETYSYCPPVPEDILEEILGSR